MAVKVPFSIIPAEALLPISHYFLALGTPISKVSPFLKFQLLQAGIKLAPKEWASLAIVVAISNSALFGMLIYLLGLVAGADFIMFALTVGGVIGLASFITILSYPSVVSKRRVKALENNLISALRQMLIELKSGVSLFEAMKSVTVGYGEVSREFKEITDHVEGGVPEIVALNDASARNPSFKFRRAIWQISNALSVGSDVTVGLQDMINDLTKEKLDDIKRYGQELNPWTMIYMMAAVIVPSLGMSMMSILLSFLNIPIPKILYPGVVFYLILFQIFFISFVRSRRPVID
ncbi:MAG: type II secretion system F family protein [Candidatus Micrarchaeia archaeon]|jgi:pilus assembly protein TadC